MLPQAVRPRVAATAAATCGQVEARAPQMAFEDEADGSEFLK